MLADLTIQQETANLNLSKVRLSQNGHTDVRLDPPFRGSCPSSRPHHPKSSLFNQIVRRNGPRIRRVSSLTACPLRP
jgi:hypothetical protein